MKTVWKWLTCCLVLLYTASFPLTCFTLKENTSLLSLGKVIFLIYWSKNSSIASDISWIFQYSSRITRVIKSSAIGCCAPAWSSNSLLMSSCEWLTFEQLYMGWLKPFHVSNHRMHNHKMALDCLQHDDMIWQKAAVDKMDDIK